MAKMLRQLPAFIALVVICAVGAASAGRVNLGRVSVLVGSSTSGSADGSGSAVQLNTPTGCAVDGEGYVLVTDTANHVVRRVSPDGTSATWIGQSGVSGDTVGSPGTNARIGAPMDIKKTADGTSAYLAAYGSQKIYRVDMATGGLTSFFGTGIAGQASNQLNGPSGVAVATDGTVFVTEKLGNRIRQISSGGSASHFSGAQDGTFGLVDGNGQSARYNQPSGLDVHRMSGRVYVADSANRCIRKLETDGTASTVAGNTTSGSSDGLGSVARFVEPYTVAIDAKGAYVYIADKGNNAIRRMDIVTTIVDTVFGNLAAGWTASPLSTTAQITAPRGICFHNGAHASRLYAVGDHAISYVRQAHTRTVTIDLATPASSTTAAPSTTAASPVTLAPVVTNATGNLTTEAPQDGSVSGATSPVTLAAVAAAVIAVLAM